VNAAFTSFCQQLLRGWRKTIADAMERPMNGGSNRSRGGGAIIAGAIIVGVIAGIMSGQPSIGFLAGAGLGILAALLLYWRDRRG
jgi:hypothetical protein